MSYAVMCCGCGRFLAKDGSMAGEKWAGGVFDPVKLAGALLDPEKLVFTDRPGLDETAQRAGWIVVDGNHRCPECERTPYAGMVERNGAYVSRESFRRPSRSEVEATKQ